MDRNSQIVWKNQKKLRTGYTTGSCAAAAAKAAAGMLFSGEEIRQVSLMTPKGIRLYLDVERIHRENDFVSCAVKKDSGDDPDVTNGVYVYAKVSKNDCGEFLLDGGIGVGRVTKKGLSQEIGEAAINKVPRQMILEAVRGQAARCGWCGGADIMISIPEGVELARKTFNPRLGIEGGISILGTSGIVEPMSEQALTETIFLEMKMLKEGGHDWCYIVPGNYGSDFLEEKLHYDGNLAVKCSNYIGEAIDDALRLEMKGILFVGHIGKLVKLAAGVMNTHSRQADCRMEVFAAHAAMAGASGEIVKKIMESITTAEAVEVLVGEELLDRTMQTIMDKIEYYLEHRAGEKLKIGAVVFSNEQGILGKTYLADFLADRIRENG